jgi:acyl-CoA thioester hydrolase
LIYYPRFFHFAVVGLNEYFGTGRESEHLMDSLRRDGYVLPAVEASGSFDAPLYAGDTARVRTTVEHFGETSLTVSFRVTRSEDGEHVASVEVSFVLVDDTFEPAALPESMRERIEARGDGDRGSPGDRSGAADSQA